MSTQLANSLSSKPNIPSFNDHGGISDGDRGASTPHSKRQSSASSLSTSVVSTNTIVDEETPLLCGPTKQDTAPLPWGQLSIILLVQASVMKIAIGELTEVSHHSLGFSLLSGVWAVGAALGPLIGGTFSRPADRFPDVFTGTFWKQYPYFLPCLVTAAFALVSFGIALIFFKETISYSTLRSSPSEETLHQDNDPPVSFRQLLVYYPVILSIANYMSIAFLNIGVDALLPLFLAMPLNVGGLGFKPHTIGYIIGLYGASTGIIQILVFPALVRIAGIRRMFLTAVAAFSPIFVLFPIISLNAQEFGVNAFTWVCIACIIGLMTLADMSFGCVLTCITASAPNKRSLGATHGLSQTVVSVARAIGPTMATSLFAFSVDHGIFGGYGVYVILFVLSGFAFYLALCLPHRILEEVE
ncbi:hypothetical protein C0995_011204 [Termitomyces sp. Mi166|nr:hypothetical protein C0995_011204 [Termitomyces sp. Mi166\